MAFHVTPATLAEIAAILSYLKQESPRAAQRFEVRLNEVFRSIEAHPLAGRTTNKPKLRSVNTHPFPYLVFYRVLAADITVIAVRHGARNPRGMPARPR